MSRRNLYIHKHNDQHPFHLLLLRKNWTSAEFGRRIGHSRSAVNRWRRGETVYPGEIFLSMVVASVQGNLGFDLEEFNEELHAWLLTDRTYAHVYGYYRQIYFNREAWKLLREEAEAQNG